jgi:hypothetical protein
MTSYREVAQSLGLLPGRDDDVEILSSGAIAGGEPRTAQLTGTKALMLAVLEDAIRCYLDGRKHIAEEAEDWIRSNQRQSPFSFSIVCETLGLDPSATRIKLREIKAMAVSSREAIPRARKNVRVPGRVCTRKTNRDRRMLRKAS